MAKYRYSIADDVEAVGMIPVVNSILEVVCRTTGMGYAVVARVTETKWVACAVRDDINFGLKPGGELVLETTLCHEVRQFDKPVIIDHVAKDELYANHHTPRMYGLQSYIAIPIKLKDGSFFGTLCAIDPDPHILNTPEVIGMFNLFADLISFHLEAIDELAVSEAKLVEERKIAELREQFIAILGHDLRNPVSAVSNVSQLLLRMPLDERTTRLANILKDASFRMKGLIENVMDFATGRMGGGITLTRADAPIEVALNQVIDELNLIYPDTKIETHFEFAGPVNHDSRRISQLFSNVLTNAVTHGKKDSPIIVKATQCEHNFELSICNNGAQIPAKTMERLFQPFSRGDNKKGQQGLGLGLYIASEIAQAHGGTLTATSNPDTTCFTFKIPFN